MKELSLTLEINERVRQQTNTFNTELYETYGYGTLKAEIYFAIA